MRALYERYASWALAVDRPTIPYPLFHWWSRREFDSVALEEPGRNWWVVGVSLRENQ